MTVTSCSIPECNADGDGELCDRHATEHAHAAGDDRTPHTGDIVTTPVPVEFLYGVDSSVSDDSQFYEPPRIVQFRITKKTPKRIYYVASADWETRIRIGFVDRQRIEADGEIHQRNRPWSAPDFHLYLNPPELQQPAGPDLPRLKAEMHAAHPDRGGTEEAFIAARRRYEHARRREAS